MRVKYLAQEHSALARAQTQTARSALTIRPTRLPHYLTAVYEFIPGRHDLYIRVVTILKVYDDKNIFSSVTKHISNFSL